MLEQKMTQFGFDIQLLGEVREVTWSRHGGFQVHGLRYSEAKELLDVLQNLDATREALGALKTAVDDVGLSAPKNPAVANPVKPTPYHGSVEKDVDPSPSTPKDTNTPPMSMVTSHRVTPEKPSQETSPRVADEHVVAQVGLPNNPSVITPPTPPTTQQTKSTEATTEPVLDGPDKLFEEKISQSTPPPISDNDRAKLATKLTDIKTTSDAVAKSGGTQGMDPNKVLDYYKTQGTKNKTAKKRVTRKKAPPRVQPTQSGKDRSPLFTTGTEYNGQRIIRVAVEETHHGEMQCLTLENGDSAMVDLGGREIEYVVCDNEEPKVTEPKVDLKDTSKAPAVTKLEPPQDLLDSRVMNGLLKWVIDVRHPKGVDTPVLVEEMWQLRTRAKSLVHAKNRDQVERRVVNVLSSLSIPVARA